MANLSHSEHDEALITYPLPLKEQEDGKKLWIINGYRVWAQTYELALEQAANIDTF